MIGLLLRTRARRLRNFIRHHFDTGTLLRLALIVALALFQFGRSPNDVGWSPGAVTRPGFGAAWSRGLFMALPLLALAFYGAARLTRRATDEARLLHVLAAPPAALARWAAARQLARCAPLIVPAALLAAGGPTLTPGGAARAAAWLFGLSALAVALLRLAPPRLEGGGAARPRPAVASGRTGAARRRGGVRISGGPIRGLVTRDLTYLLRWQRSPLVLVALAALLEALAAARTRPPADAPLAVGMLQIVAVFLVVNTLESLFTRDVPHAGLLRTLPLTGRQFWLARAGLAAVLMAVPILPALVVLAARGVGFLPFMITLAVAGAALPAATALLYANVGVALFPRTRLIPLFLNAALLFMTFFWFFVPVATPLLALFVLGAWARRAPLAFDRWEAS